MIQDKLTFVLPLKINTYGKGSDLDRVENILLPSLLKYFCLNDIDKILVITPDEDVETVSSKLNRFVIPLKLWILNEEKVLEQIPGWRKHKALDRYFHLPVQVDKKFNRGRLSRRFHVQASWWTMKGWLKQQMLKLASAALVNTPYYMTLDADLCLMHACGMRDIFPDGRPIYTTYVARQHYNWWQGAAEALGFELGVSPDAKVLSVTPEVLSKPAVESMLLHIADRSHCMGYPTLFNYLAERSDWTEYSLYWLYLQKKGWLNRYFSDQTVKQTLDTRQSVWMPEDASDPQKLSARIAMARDDRCALFMVLQSSGVLFDDCHAAVKAHLE